MEKIGLIADEISPRISEICDEVEKISKNRYKIGYCYLYRGVAADKSQYCQSWLSERKISVPDRLQETLRNCDVLLTVCSETTDTCFLPLMTGKDTFVLLPDDCRSISVSRLSEIAAGYGTNVCFGELAQSGIPEKITVFFNHE